MAETAVDILVESILARMKDEGGMNSRGRVNSGARASMVHPMYVPFELV